MSAEEFNKKVKELRQELGFPKYEQYEIAHLKPEIEPIVNILRKKGEWGDAHAVAHALTNIHLENQKNTTWRKRVLKGALLLDEIRPGWENIRFDDFEHKLKYVTEWESILKLVFKEDDLRKILPLIFAGVGVQDAKGARRHPGPAPTSLTEPGQDIWEGEISTGYYEEAKMHGFISGVQRSADYLSPEDLTIMWIDFILLRKINQLQEGE